MNRLENMKGLASITHNLDQWSTTIINCKIIGYHYHSHTLISIRKKVQL